MDTPPPGLLSVVGRVVAALLLLVNFVVAWDLLTAALWGIGLGIFGSAVVGLVGALRGRRSPVIIAACLASIVLFPASCVAQFKAASLATRRVHTLADEAQTRCDATGLCPDVVALCGGTVEPGRSGHGGVVGSCGTAGTTVRFPIFYAVSDGGRRFSVSARLNIDMSVSSEGGVGLPLRRTSLIDGVEEVEVVRPASTPAAPSTSP